MKSSDWALRGRIFILRFWQPTSACLTCMPGNVGNIASLVHWEIALRTGLTTGALVLLLSFTPFIRVFRSRYGNALVVGSLTAIGDALSHSGHYGGGYGEAVLTGIVSGLLALAGSWLFEDRARRVRSAWRRVAGPPSSTDRP
jgi:hypothetical protein